VGNPGAVGNNCDPPYADRVLQNATWVLSLSAPTSGVVKVYLLYGGSAVPGVDYTEPTNYYPYVVSIPPGVTNLVVPIPLTPTSGGKTIWVTAYYTVGANFVQPFAYNSGVVRVDNSCLQTPAPLPTPLELNPRFTG
jgi:hypothetical protein